LTFDLSYIQSVPQVPRYRRTKLWQNTVKCKDGKLAANNVSNLRYRNVSPRTSRYGATHFALSVVQS
jgi:hypothetical protein